MSEVFLRCIGCGGLVPAITGPAHRYMESSPGCWQTYGEVLAREYSDPEFAAAHGRAVDAYAVQHPGQLSPQSIQSIGLHLVRLCLLLEHGFNDEAAGEATFVISRGKAKFHWLTPPRSMGEVTAIDVWKTEGASAHVQRVRGGQSPPGRLGSQHHDQIEEWVPEHLRRGL